MQRQLGDAEQVSRDRRHKVQQVNCLPGEELPHFPNFVFFFSHEKYEKRVGFGKYILWFHIAVE